MRWQAIQLTAAMLAGASPASAQLGPAEGRGDPAPESAAPAVSRIERAWQNYTAVAAGQRDLSQLSAEELEDLIELDRRVRAQRPDVRSPRQRCIDEELDGLGHAPSRLALRSIDLKCSQR